MYWQHPYYLFGLWLLPLVAALLVYAHRKRIASARQFADPAMVERLMPPLSGPRPWIKGSLILAGVALLILALARPRFGVYFEKVSQRGVDLYVALDVSRSMDAEDITPSRLERAKFEIRDLLTRLVGDRVGLIVFAGKPVVKVPLTTDYGFFQMVLDSIDTGSAPRGGTMIGDAIRKAMEAMPEQRDRDRVIVLITDGEDHDSYPQEAAEQAGEGGIKIFTVALGNSREGARIPIRDEQRGLQYLKYAGQEHWSKVDDRLLKEIAVNTQGAYIPSAALTEGLGKIYDNHLAKLAQGEIQEEKRKRYREQFQLFVCLGLVLLMIEMAIPSYQRSSQEETRSIPARTSSKVAMVLLCLTGSTRTAWADSPDGSESVDQGIAYYRSGEYQKAVSAFQDADVARPDDPWIAFNLATSYAAQGDSKKAEELFRQAALTRDERLAARCHYNLGTLAAAGAQDLFGEHPDQATMDVRSQGLSLLAEAITHYRDCLHLDSHHADARHNLEVIRLWMKHMQALWEEQDRKKDREEMDLLQFLAVLERKEGNLRDAVRSIAGEPDSPRRRQAILTTATDQRQLQEEIEPLKQKIVEALQPSQTQGNPSPSPPPAGNSMKDGIEILHSLADQAANAMLAAADSLDAADFQKTSQEQDQSLKNLDQIYLGVVPFPTLVERAIDRQQGLIEQVTPAADPANQSEEEVATNMESDLDLDELAWNQEFLTGWAHVLGPKAAHQLKQLDTMPDSAAGPGSVPGIPQPPGTDPEAAKQQLDGLKQSIERAIELGPKVESLSSDAVVALREKKIENALPNQKEALKLLKEIAEPLPKQDKKQQEEQQPNQEEQKKQDAKNQADQKQQQEDNQKQKAQRQRDLSKQQAESLMRKVRERQQERKEQEQQLQKYLAKPGEVEKDW
ncbi:MAG: VWA domain-containing protein [Pirellulales bacterium]|nr:VWA domain-containing protein [Pirellulales bacterium]